MIQKCKLPAVILLIPLLYLPAMASAEDAPFTYSNDWRLVSAPPPPGPYNAVNIDPRVPRQEAIPPMTTGSTPQPSWEPLPAEVISNPPAAGWPQYHPGSQPPQPELPEDEMPAPLPGAYQGHMPAPPGYGAPPSGFAPPPGQPSAYGNIPPSGYYQQPSTQDEQEVPPPPVYDALTGESGDVYRSP